MNRELLTVIIPCYNEEGNLRNTVDDVLTVAPDLPVDVEVLLIDDTSTDGTRALMEELCAEHPNLRMKVNERNQGVGVSVMEAYEEIPAGSWVTGLPGDNELVFDSIRGFLARRHDYDLILGYIQNPVIRTVRRRIASWAFTRVVAFLYGFPFRYYNGLKLYRVEVFRGLETASTGHAYMAELIAKSVLRWPTMRIGEAPFAARGRAVGQSKAFRPGSILKAVREAWSGWRSVTHMRRRILSGEEPMLGQSGERGYGSAASPRIEAPSSSSSPSAASSATEDHDAIHGAKKARPSTE